MTNVKSIVSISLNPMHEPVRSYIASRVSDVLGYTVHNLLWIYVSSCAEADLRGTLREELK